MYALGECAPGRKGRRASERSTDESLSLIERFAGLVSFDLRRWLSHARVGTPWGEPLSSSTSISSSADWRMAIHNLVFIADIDCAIFDPSVWSGLEVGPTFLCAGSCCDSVEHAHVVATDRTCHSGRH